MKTTNRCMISGSHAKVWDLTTLMTQRKAFAEDCGKIIGVILSGHDGRRGYIYHTAVHPEQRHKGIATKLVDSALAALKSLGINKTALVVFSRNKDGNAFWEKYGFTPREDLVYRNKALADMKRIDT